MSAITPTFLGELAAIVGRAAMRVGAELEAVDPGADPQNLAAGLMARPGNSAEVARVLALCARCGVGVVPQGGRTGLAGAARTVRGELILSLDRMSAIVGVDAVARTATVEAGVTLARLEEALAPYRLSAGIDLGARGSATIGGMVSTNAGGSDAFRHGTMRQRVLGLEVALADGSVLSELSQVRKDNAGLPLRQLFIGSEGTLGVITRIVLSLVPASDRRRSVLAILPDLGAAVALLRDVEAVPQITLAAAELMSGNHVALTARSLGVAQLAAVAESAVGLLMAACGPDDGSVDAAIEEVLGRAADGGRVVDAVLPKNLAEERDLWRIREDWAVDRTYPGGLWFDVSVPVSGLDRYVRELTGRLARHDPRLRMYLVGHLADGNVHVTVNADAPVAGRYAEIAPIVYSGLRELGGSFSAEHGIGLEKRDSLERWTGETGLRLMRAVKAAFDPRGILNPGKVIRTTPAN